MIIGFILLVVGAVVAGVAGGVALVVKAWPVVVSIIKWVFILWMARKVICVGEEIATKFEYQHPYHPNGPALMRALHIVLAVLVGFGTWAAWNWIAKMISRH